LFDKEIEMKVLHIVPWYEPAWSAGGTATAVSILCRSLAKQGVDITVYTTDDAGQDKRLKIPLVQPVVLGKVKVFYFKCKFIGNYKSAFYSRGLSRALKENIKNFDLVHISGARHWHGYKAVKLAHKHKIPVMFTAHGSLMNSSILEIGNIWLKKLYISFFDKRVLKKVSAFHFLCEGEREASVNSTFNKPSFIASNGIDIHYFRRDKNTRFHLRKKYNLDDKSIALIYTGRIHPVKNLHLIIEALNKINSNSNEKIYFFIVGAVSDISYLEFLNNLISKKIKENIIFIKSVPPKKIVEWYTMADLFVMPSKVEGVSMSLIEAMSSSLPCLVSDRVANFREIQKDKAGMIVKPNLESVTAALKKILKNKSLLKKLSENARRTAEKRYDKEITVKKILKEYEKILRNERNTKNIK